MKRIAAIFRLLVGRERTGWRGWLLNLLLFFCAFLVPPLLFFAAVLGLGLLTTDDNLLLVLGLFAAVGVHGLGAVARRLLVGQREQLWADKAAGRSPALLRPAAPVASLPFVAGDGLLQGMWGLWLGAHGAAVLWGGAYFMAIPMLTFSVGGLFWLPWLYPSWMAIRFSGGPAGETVWSGLRTAIGALFFPVLLSPLILLVLLLLIGLWWFLETLLL